MPTKVHAEASDNSGRYMISHAGLRDVGVTDGRSAPGVQRYPGGAEDQVLALVLARSPDSSATSSYISPRRADCISGLLSHS